MHEDGRSQDFTMGGSTEAEPTAEAVRIFSAGRCTFFFEKLTNFLVVALKLQLVHIFTK